MRVSRIRDSRPVSVKEGIHCFLDSFLSPRLFFNLLLFTGWMSCVCVFVCERGGKEREKGQLGRWVVIYLCVCV